MQHLLTSWQPMWQPGNSNLCTCKQTLMGLESRIYHVTVSKCETRQRLYWLSYTSSASSTDLNPKTLKKPSWFDQRKWPIQEMRRRSTQWSNQILDAKNFLCHDELVRWTKLRIFRALLLFRHGGCEWTTFSAPSQLVPPHGWVVLSGPISSNLPGSCGRLSGGHVPPASDRGTETKIWMCHLVGLISNFY